MKNIDLINHLMCLPPNAEVEMYREGENDTIHHIFVTKDDYAKPYILFTGEDEDNAEAHETLLI